MLSSKWWNNKANNIKLVYLYSTIKTMHVPINKEELSIPVGKSTPCSVAGIKQLHTSLAQRTYLCVPYFVTKAMLFPYTIQIGSCGLQERSHDDPNSRGFPQVWQQWALCAAVLPNHSFSTGGQWKTYHFNTSYISVFISAQSNLSRTLSLYLLTPPSCFCALCSTQLLFRREELVKNSLWMPLTFWRRNYFF